MTSDQGPSTGTHQSVRPPDGPLRLQTRISSSQYGKNRTGCRRSHGQDSPTAKLHCSLSVRPCRPERLAGTGTGTTRPRASMLHYAMTLAFISGDCDVADFSRSSPSPTVTGRWLPARQCRQCRSRYLRGHGHQPRVTRRSTFTTFGIVQFHCSGFLERFSEIFARLRHKGHSTVLPRDSLLCTKIDFIITIVVACWSP